MKKLSNTEAELKKSVAYKKSVYGNCKLACRPFPKQVYHSQKQPFTEFLQRSCSENSKYSYKKRKEPLTDFFDGTV